MCVVCPCENVSTRCFSGCALMSSFAFPATMEGMQFDDSVQVGSTEVKLNGLGLRAVLFIRGYVAGSI